MKKAIIYTRVSTDKQAEKGYSLRDQKNKLEKYCADKGYEIVKHFQDDHSAKTFNRPEFQNLLEFIRRNKGSVNKLVVIKWDRFSRDMEASMNMLTQLLRYGVAVEAIDQPLDDSIPENLLMKAIYLAAPQVENARRSLNTINGMRRAAKEGRWISTPPMGYKMIRDENNKPILALNEKAPLIAEAFELYAKGFYHINEVRLMMKKKGLHCSRNNFWLIIHNPVYCGKIFIKAWKDEPEQLVKGIHPAIISEELFYKVQDIAEGKKRIKAKPRKKREAFPLRGLLVCSRCGKNLTGSASKGNGGIYHYYHCQPGCNERHKTDVAHNSFSEWLDSLSVKPEMAAMYLKVMEDIFTEKEGSIDKEITRLKSEILKRSELVVKVEKRFMEDELDSDSYKRLKHGYQREQFEFKEQLTELQTTDSGFMEYAKSSFALLTHLKEAYAESDLESKQKLIGLIFPEKLIYENGKYRTIKESEVFRLFLGKNADFTGLKEQWVGNFANPSQRVVPTGIEPVSRV
jgi:site-specific DNA recombinase